jgi:dimethylamine monooxygenase subunit C
MSKTVFPPSIRSRPVYGELSLRPGQSHLIVADGEGAMAVADMFAKAGKDASAALAASHIMYAPGPNGTDEGEVLKVLADAHMGMQVYLAGTEGLIGQCQTAAEMAGLPHEAVQTEHRGSTVRRVQCVHCKGITENVRTDPFVCSHCGLHLFVRDHYSRRLAAFQGVNIDAEDPGQVPPMVERFK